MKLSFFISYSRRDEHVVYRYADDIKKHLNVMTWVDKDDIPTGRDWWEGICEGIRECDFFMFFLSPPFGKLQILHGGIAVCSCPEQSRIADHDCRNRPPARHY